MVPILVILTFVIIAAIYALIQRSKQRTLLASLGMTAPVLPDYQFTPGHLWLDRLASGHLRLGLDELIPKFMGAPDRVHLVDDGELVRRGEPLAIFSKGGKDIFLNAPANMRILKTNRSLIRQPARVNLDPYHKGWLYHVSIENNNSPIRNLLTGEKAKLWLNGEIQRLKDFVSENLDDSAGVPNTAYDGGLLINGLIDQVDQAVVSKFEQQFLFQARM